MTKPTKTLPLSEAPAGARLAADVRGADGKVLVSAGAELAADLLERLARRGVEEVTVEAPPDTAALEAGRLHARRRLEHIFRHCDRERDDGARMIFEAALRHRLEEPR